ncbi:tRNA 2-selenouridine(34) synthase MnmH [Candidatus Woesearchaeota archaeon]|jgi:tRNA 2-selenouridine synthase|nr:tRNA 2-selenouridine(34) synthase MnmH [Candidatus Woesearchaeota archaeon]MBT6336152.1 tRNA 2-selenouridine(34) synthase MnmH [Candidatus Woesearchaeota archaeon]MBT7928097.1 tRNA 2-selenouridine(34) synthase MnmH [Candidatus Woesearchaeota archaeon]
MDTGKEIYQKVQKFEPKKITCLELTNSVIFDARTKKEFDNHHIPGAIHIPLVNNEEYHNVGYLYKQVSPKVAYDVGFDYIFKNVQEIIEKAKEFKDKNIVVYCARGGLRSKTLVYLLKTQGFNVVQLKEGMKGYRNFVLAELENIKIPKLIVLQGLAGSRKTALLEKLDNKIDLELCAKHNSSAFGALDHVCNSQKQFLFDLYEQMKKVKDCELVFIEGEARKVGSVEIPKRLWEQMNNSKIIFLDVSLENRSKHFTEEYPSMKKYFMKYVESTNSLKKLISNDMRKQLIEFITANKPFEFWMLILKDYYDPRYEHAFKSITFDKTIDANDFEKTLKVLKSFKPL